MADGVRFVRINGRIVPIKNKGEGNKGGNGRSAAVHTSPTSESEAPMHRAAKTGAAIGAGVGGLIGSPLGFKGAAISSLIGANVGGALGAYGQKIKSHAAALKNLKNKRD